jgi:hypothetical protein
MVKDFIAQSVELKWPWQYISLLGGEPTLHPQIEDVLQAFSDYRSQHNPDCRIELLSNMFGPKAKDIVPKTIWKYHLALKMGTRKTSPNQKFVAYNVAPIDMPEFQGVDFANGCWIPYECGLGLTVNGFYPCGAGAAVDRIFGFNLGVKQLKDVNEGILERFKTLCCYCGRWHGRVTDKQEISDSWKQA